MRTDSIADGCLEYIEISKVVTKPTKGGRASGADETGQRQRDKRQKTKDKRRKAKDKKTLYTRQGAGCNVLGGGEGGGELKPPLLYLSDPLKPALPNFARAVQENVGAIGLGLGFGSGLG